jgi:uncharacterized membrane protein (UPF0127 family)
VCRPIRGRLAAQPPSSPVEMARPMLAPGMGGTVSLVDRLISGAGACANPALRAPGSRTASARPARSHIARALVALFMVVAGFVGAGRPAVSAAMQTLEIVSSSGVHVFSVELATNDEERERGLMFRTSIPEGQGMLFDFASEQNVSMWMKNTLIPLDMLFIRGDGRIARIAENTEPMSTRIISSGVPVLAVLEVAGGTAGKLGIKAGDRVAHPMFRAR